MAKSAHGLHGQTDFTLNQSSGIHVDSLTADSMHIYLQLSKKFSNKKFYMNYGSNKSNYTPVVV